jgi:hypothetical protein
VPGHDWLVDRFEAHRAHLRAVAYRMLGSRGEADDAVQEAWLRLSRSDASEIENLGGWLTTVVGRVSLDMLRSRASRREEPAGARLPDHIEVPTAGSDPEHEALLADTSGQRCSWSSTCSAPPSGSRSCCTTCSRCRSTRSGPSWAAPRTGPNSSRAVPATRCRDPARLPTPIPPASEKRRRLPCRLTQG